MYKWSHENHISYKQLELDILRQFLSEKRNWKCQHDKKDLKFSRKTKQPYCKNCYQFMDRVIEKGITVFKPKCAAWDNTMTVEQWSKQIAPNNKALK